MAGLGELIILLIQWGLGLLAFVFLFLVFKVKPKEKVWMLAGSLFSYFLFFSFRSHLNDLYLDNQRDQVGIYYLTNYPDCDNCILELKEDHTYEVRDDYKILEQSDWHYESGGDYWITYLDNDNHQLGSGV